MANTLFDTNEYISDPFFPTDYQEILQRIKQPAEANGGTREFFGMMPDSVVQSRGSRTIHISQGSEREKSAGELYTRACKGVQSARSFIN